ncbi:hypothetical protein Rcae01_05556 [Novipirellula caenicola]|uniref:Uncharacterized protein n=1 Tax=Novipirellula caenicola TaxID=1536901 RepID=A0ABP9W0M7_9BACT
MINRRGGLVRLRFCWCRSGVYDAGDGTESLAFDCGNALRFGCVVDIRNLGRRFVMRTSGRSAINVCDRCVVDYGGGCGGI